MEYLIETERLHLRLLQLEDAPFILNLLNTPEWLKYIGDRSVHTLDDARNYLSDRLIASYDTYGFGLYAMVKKEDESLIGICGFVKRDYLEAVDIGFALLPQFSRQGYTYEAAVAVISYAKTVLKLNELLAITNQKNVASIALLEKLSFSFTEKIKAPQEEEFLFLFQKIIAT